MTETIVIFLASTALFLVGAFLSAYLTINLLERFGDNDDAS